MDEAIKRHPASYRDPAGFVFIEDDAIHRAVTEAGRAQYEAVKNSGALDRLMGSGRLVHTVECYDAELLAHPQVAYVLAHELLPLISYPYEWCFAALKKAALFHLELHLDALEWDATLSDASAYNIQFKGAEPIFIDILSLIPYVEGTYWTGHRQFCEQFVGPLLIQSTTGVPFQSLLRSNIEGIPAEQIGRLVPRHRKMSLSYFFHIGLPAYFNTRAKNTEASDVRARPFLPKVSYRWILEQMRQWVVGFSPPHAPSTWADYSSLTSYRPDEAQQKIAFLQSFARGRPGATIVDFGCNDGEFSEVLLGSGAGTVIGIDCDPNACNAAFRRAEAKGLNLQVLQMDLANPSPAQGWFGRERASFDERLRADGMIALAVLHHLVIGSNIPMAEAVDWLTGFGTCGVIEFVPKTDTQVLRMLRLRDDIFEDYDEAAFLNRIEGTARIVETIKIEASGRLLVRYDRRPLGTAFANEQA